MDSEDTDVEDTESEELPADPTEALNRLKWGNANYTEGQVKIASWTPEQWKEQREELQPHQHPWAVIWGCIDSRVPPELIFDCGLGDLFVIRTAGQVPDPAALGSLEFAVKYQNEDETYPVKLVLVLGHTACGAVKATVNNFDPSKSPSSEDMGSIPALVKSITPAYITTKIHWREQYRKEFWIDVEADETAYSGMFLDEVIRTNIKNQVEQLRMNPILAEAVSAERIQIIGACYDLGTGQVEMITELGQEQ